MSDVCDCEFFDEGDWVESKLNPNVFGIVVGEHGFGQYYDVQIVETLEIKSFHGVTLKHMPEQDAPPPAAAIGDGDNVIKVDFTKGSRLTPGSDTKGAA